MAKFEIGKPYPEDVYDQPYLMWVWSNRLVLVLEPGQADTVHAIDDGDISLGLLPFEDVIYIVLRVWVGESARYWHSPVANLQGNPSLASVPASPFWNLMVCQTLNNDSKLANLTITTNQAIGVGDEFTEQLEEAVARLLAKPALSVQEFVAQTERFEEKYPTGERMWAACTDVAL